MENLLSHHFFCILGTIALGYITYTSPPPQNSSTFIEVTKTVFLCLGGLGVILPLYINATNAMEARLETIESRNSTIEAAKNNRTIDKIENTFRLIERWDDPHLFSARKLTREIGDSRSSISDDDLIAKIKSNDELRQSVILVCNYFEQVRFSIINDRIESDQFKSTLGPIIKNIISRFMPYFKTLSEQHIKDLQQLENLLS